MSKSTIDLLNVKRIGRTSLDCNLSSEYVDISRKVSEIDNGVSITDSVVIKKNMIPNEKLSEPAFTKFQDEARSCFNRAAVIVEKR